jgi:hypothetical protein
MRPQKCLRALRVQRLAELLKLIELYHAVTDVRTHDEARQSIPEMAFV